MEVALRGLGVVNSDGTIGITVDPNAGNISPVVTTPKNAINYGAMPSPIAGMSQAEYDAIQADLAQLAPGSAIDSTAAIQVAEANLQLQALANAPVSVCAAGQVLSNGVCVGATFGIPNTTLIWIGVAFVAMLFLKGNR